MRTFGKYRLLEPLASGGMADVFRAEVSGAEGVTKEVALKLVRGEHDQRSEFVRMFVEEARLASRLTHANVVQVFEFDQVEGRYYIAMELVRGRHLGHVADRCRERGLRFGVARAVHVGAEVARALAYAHRLAGADGCSLGLVHRDVSPHNVLVSFEGEVKLADFGIARAMSRVGLTRPGTIKGKLAYMAPEQARGEPVDARADVFSLGVVLWELCAGRRLFARESEAATLAAVLSSERLSPPSAWNEEVPAEIDAAVLSALERDPSRRTASAQLLATALSGLLLRVARSPEEIDLRAFMHRLWPEAAVPAAPVAHEPTRVRPRPASLHPASGETATRTAPRPGGRLARAAALGAFLLLAAGTAATLALSRRPHAAARGVPSADAAPFAAPAPALAVVPPPSIDPAALEPPGAQGKSPSVPGAGDGRAIGASAEASPRAVSRPACSPQLLRVPPPPRESGQGLVVVTANPWATVSVDGVVAGDTPCGLRLPAGRHRLRASHASRPPVEVELEVEAGRRRTWTPSLSR